MSRGEGDLREVRVMDASASAAAAGGRMLLAAVEEASLEEVSEFE